MISGDFYDKDGNIYVGNDPYMLQLISDMRIIMRGACGSNLIQVLVDAPQNIVLWSDQSNNYYQNENISWDPENIYQIRTTEGTMDNISFVSLAHELAHAWDDISGTLNLDTWISQETMQQFDCEMPKDIPYAEIKATFIENQIRAEQNLPLRTHYLKEAGTDVSRVVDGKGRSIYMNKDGNTSYRRVRPKNRYDFNQQ
ncbi:M91 family zinc metallopeptidase [Alistipes putredinis]|uniref:M91 family zinc metallopeptidase n=1 Tax=Alistipes putredinis TaxID=28117 RepID=UPI0031FE7D12